MSRLVSMIVVAVLTAMVMVYEVDFRLYYCFMIYARKQESIANFFRTYLTGLKPTEMTQDNVNKMSKKYTLALFDDCRQNMQVIDNDKLYEMLRSAYKDDDQVDPNNVMFIHRNLTLFVHESLTAEESRIQDEMDILRNMDPQQLQSSFHSHFKYKEEEFSFWKLNQIIFDNENAPYILIGGAVFIIIVLVAFIFFYCFCCFQEDEMFLKDIAEIKNLISIEKLRTKKTEKRTDGVRQRQVQQPEIN